MKYVITYFNYYRARLFKSLNQTYIDYPGYLYSSIVHEMIMKSLLNYYQAGNYCNNYNHMI